MGSRLHKSPLNAAEEAKAKTGEFAAVREAIHYLSGEGTKQREQDRREDEWTNKQGEQSTPILTHPQNQFLCN